MRCVSVLPAAVGHPSASTAHHPHLILQFTLPHHAPLPAASSLTLERVLVRNVTLSPAAADGASAAVPRLLPLGLLTEAPARLTLIDVRMVVRQQDFDDYLALFRRELSTPAQQKSAGALIHTVCSCACGYRCVCLFACLCGAALTLESDSRTGQQQ
jgi:hypothetical protein